MATMDLSASTSTHHDPLSTFHPWSQEQGNSEDSICWFPQLPPDLLVRMLSQMGLEDHHMSRAACITFYRAYGGEDGVWMSLYLLHFISVGVTLPELFTWQQAEQRYSQHLRELVLNALRKIAPGSVRAGSSFMRAGQEFKKYEDLDLSNCTCDSLPLEVWSIQTLVRLNLSRCRLRELSPGLLHTPCFHNPHPALNFNLKPDPN